LQNGLKKSAFQGGVIKEEKNMDTGAMIKGHISLQKQAFNNFMDAMAIFQDQAVRANRILADQIKIDEKAREFADQWRMALNKGRDDFRAQVNEAYARIEELYDGSEQHLRSEK
jgi:hypothetical protein